MKDTLLQQLGEITKQVSDTIGDLTTNEKIAYPIAGGVAGYLVGKQIKDNNNFPLLTGLIGAGVGSLIAKNNEEKK